MVRKERDSSSYRPSAGDRVICLSDNCPYDAKVLNVGTDPKDKNERNAETKYFVHYRNWNKNWDEWVSIDRIQEYNDANAKAMVDFHQNAKAKPSKAIGSARKKIALERQQSDRQSSQEQSRQSVSNASNTSVSQDSTSDSMVIEPDEIPVVEKEVKIKIPDELKTWLIDDDNQIKNKKLSDLPAKPPIITILKDFVLSKRGTTKTSNESVLGELTLGIKDYFNVMLGSHLLYKFERLQYQYLLKEQGKDVDLAAHYGVIHLVRMFTKIGKLLAHSTLDSQSIQTVVNYMQDLLKFISKQPNLFDLERNYTVAPPDYIKNSLK